MRFTVKQKIFSFTDSFVIEDENKRPAYQVKGRLFSLGDQLRIYDMNNEEKVYIRQEIFKLLPEYHFFEQGRKIGVVKKQFTFMKPKFNITSPSGSYTVEGNFLGYNFRILKNGNLVARVDKAFFAFKDTYSVSISPGEDEAFLLGVCIVIDQTLHDKNHNNH